MLFGHWFPPHETRSSELGSGCILSTFKFKRSSTNLKIALIFFPGSGSESDACYLDIGFHHMLFALPNSALDAFYLCLVNVF